MFQLFFLFSVLVKSFLPLSIDQTRTSTGWTWRTTSSTSTSSSTTCGRRTATSSAWRRPTRDDRRSDSAGKKLFPFSGSFPKMSKTELLQKLTGFAARSVRLEHPLHPLPDRHDALHRRQQGRVLRLASNVAGEVKKGFGGFCAS